ncbi:hypothetical protein B296_00046977 [Ensete ventricosum]|uniref:BHLH domain-containing protein n=1 Tax=Ensete ventricosum TaxID=4639 RepID=A0A426X3G7_ENSVE|nr:hypothetical protein B296_00046977 [Ensete ventricosum]
MSLFCEVVAVGQLLTVNTATAATTVASFISLEIYSPPRPPPRYHYFVSSLSSFVLLRSAQQDRKATLFYSPPPLYPLLPLCSLLLFVGSIAPATAVGSSSIGSLLHVAIATLRPAASHIYRSQRHSSSLTASSSSPPAQAAPSSLSNDSLSSSYGILSSAPACLKLVSRSTQSRYLLLFLPVELFPQLTTTSTSATLTVNKKPKSEASCASTGHGAIKVRKEKLGNRITTLQQLVSPFGKYDTASVLHKALSYIRFLHDQVQVLRSSLIFFLKS